MEGILKLLKDEAIRSSPIILIIVILGYFGKVYLEGQIGVINDRLTAVASSSLNIKEDLRTSEREALIEFRLRVEEWQHALLSALTDFSNNKITQDSINEFYQSESLLRLEVNKSIAKLGVLTRNEELYVSAYDTLIDISRMYDPYIAKYLPVLIDIQAELEPIYQRMALYEESANGGKPFEYTLEQAKFDQQHHKEIQANLLEVMKQSAEEILILQPKLIERLTDLKESMNAHVYRPITSTRIDED